MLTLNDAALTHLAGTNRRITVAGIVYKRDGTTVTCTQHDEDLLIEDGDLAGIYYANNAVTGSDVRASSDMSVDNMEIAGNFNDRLDFAGFSLDDVEAGLFKNAPFETFLCQWDAPNAWQKVVRRGYIGQIKHTAEGAFNAEWRGILQLFSQTVGRTYAETCDVVRFGDARCKKDLTPLRINGTISAATSGKRFTVTFDTPPPATPGYWDIGEFVTLTGANAGFEKQIKTAEGSGSVYAVELWESMPELFADGDRATLTPGCDRRWESCTFWDNVINFRGHGRWMPSIPAIIRAP